MIELLKDGNTYRLPSLLNDFQKRMYIHLINWKWKHITKEPGIYTYRNGEYIYDAIIPSINQKTFPLIYPNILSDILKHQESYPFKLHKHFNHMASSQAANANLFLPILLSPLHDKILQQLKPDFSRLATGEMYKGFRIEFWDGYFPEEKGLLKDHSPISGTDSDIAIAYYNKNEELCLWLIEHKLTEKEFTTCGGSKSSGRGENHTCDKTFKEIISNKDYCYYHSVRGFKYWDLTEKHQNFFINDDSFTKCPFINGMNQLWRNQLLALELESSSRYKNVYFSVVRHPENDSLGSTIKKFKELIDNSPKFSDFTSNDVINAAETVKDETINTWMNWYCDLYGIKN